MTLNYIINQYYKLIARNNDISHMEVIIMALMAIMKKNRIRQQL